MNAGDVITDAEDVVRIWADRNTRFEQDLQLYEIKKEVQKAGYPNYKGNDSRTYGETMMAFLTGNMPRHRIPIIKELRDEREQISKNERLLAGIWNSCDEFNTARMRPTVQYELAYHLVLTGWYAALAMVRKGDYRFHCEIFDPYNIYPRATNSGVDTLVHKYETTVGDIEQRWDKKLSNNQNEKVTVYDYWKWYLNGSRGKRVLNAVATTMGPYQSFVKEPVFEPFDRIPLLVGTAAGSPIRRQYGRQWAAEVGNSIYSANRFMYEEYDNWMTLMLRIVDWLSEIVIMLKSPEGKAFVDPQKLRESDLTTVPMRLQQSMEILQKGIVPPDLVNIMGEVTGQIQRGSVPFSLYGNIPFQLSGFAINQLLQAAFLRTKPYIQAMEQFYASADRLWLGQLKRSRQKTTLYGQMHKKGGYFYEQFTSEDILEDPFVKIHIQPAFPQDLMQKITFARQALSSPRLMSRQTLQEEHLDVEDTDLENDKILEEMAKDDPILLRVAEANALMARGDMQGAQMILNAIGGSPQPGRQEMGVPSSGLPPEAGAEMNEDMMRIMAGRQ